MQFMEFNRRLAQCHLDDETKLLLAHMFEVLIDNNKTLDATLTVLNALADTVKRVTDLHEDTQDKLKSLAREHHAEVRSVRDEDF